MRKFEYVTFELADYAKTPALRYEKLKTDFENMSGLSEYSYISTLLSEMEEQYEPEELVVSEEEETEFWVRRLAKDMAVSMVTTGKSDPEIMRTMVALPESAFERAVALCAEMAQDLDVSVREAESKYRKTNHATL